MERAVLVIGGLVIGLLIGVGAYIVVDDDDGYVPPARRPIDELDFPALDHDPEAATELLMAWERWRTATFVARGTWSRRLDAGGEPLTGASYRVQDPPRRLVVRLGSTVERIDGTVSVCDADAVGFEAPDCVEAGSTMDYFDRVAAELFVVRAYVDGPERLYDVEWGIEAGCFRAEIVVADLRSPWGRWAEFCFDADTGAMVLSRVRRQSAVDLEELQVISDMTTDADFESR